MMNSSIVLAVLLLSALLLALLGLIAAASRHKKKAHVPLNLIGSVGRVETDLLPEGSVIVAGELWRARVSNLAEPLRRGQRARITGTDGHLLEVEPAD